MIAVLMVAFKNLRRDCIAYARRPPRASHRLQFAFCCIWVNRRCHCRVRRFAVNFSQNMGEKWPMDIVLGPGFGAELRGVTLTDVASDDAAYASARAAFEEHSVL